MAEEPGEGLLGARGEVAEALSSVDWARTPLGLPDGWPLSLQTVVRTMLASRFAMWMAWGPELTFFCNDAYRRDTLGTKFPWALGRPTAEVWHEVWADIQPQLRSVLDGGVSTWDEGLLLFLERSGFVEESYHTFSYSPLVDAHGAIVGLFCVVVEETDRIISERRIALLGALGAAITGSRTERDLYTAIGEQLAAYPRTVPFTVLYRLDGDGPARRVACTGVEPDSLAAPDELARTDGRWPLAQVLGGAAVLVETLPADIPADPWPEPPLQALALPLTQRGQSAPFGMLVVGLNRYRPYDDAYRAFLELLASQLAAGVGNARAFDDERRRAEELAELDRAKTAFFTNVSHEFRTPLTLLLGPADDALADRAEPLPDRQRERVEVVQRNAQRLLKLVNTLLDFSRIESGRAEPERRAVDLAATTGELAESFRTAVERAGLTLTVDVPPLPAAVSVDPEMWSKIVLNLLSNALKFTFEGGITVALAVGPGGSAELRVTDTGTGIPADAQPRLFERFRRVSGARSRSFEGSGIGLALVAELAVLHGGTVAVSSVPGEGSTFTVTLPFGETDALAALSAADAGPAGPATAAAERETEAHLAEAESWLTAAPEPGAELPTRSPDARPLVLVADDNADMRGHIAGLLRNDYDVLLARDGQAALELARRAQPDLVLTDVMMPRLDGFGLLAALRADPVTTATPVVMLSARAGDDATSEGLEAGADDYLVKPFAARELLARVRANLELDRVRRTRDALSRSRSQLDQAQRLARVGSWDLDLATGAVTGSTEFLRQLGITAGGPAPVDVDVLYREQAHPDDLDDVQAAIADAIDGGGPLDYRIRMIGADGVTRTFHSIGEVVRDGAGAPIAVRGSSQDITARVRAEGERARAAAEREVAARERSIADELQRSLLPQDAPVLADLEVATYYRAGVEGTQVGGDWYDVIGLGAGRTALVIGDVMGRGVRAAAVMGQLRAAVRAYARLDLPPADILEFLDGAVRELGPDQIVTCLYAVHDPFDATLTFTNAGHLPPLLALPGGGALRLNGAAGPPLGTGPLTLQEERVAFPPGSALVLYTDGLVERRDIDIDAGVAALAAAFARREGALADAPAMLVAALLPEGPDDDVAVLVAVTPEQTVTPQRAVLPIAAEPSAVSGARAAATAELAGWGVDADTVDAVVLLVSELVTNAVVHGRAPIELRLWHTEEHVLLEVRDGGALQPRRLRPSPEDERGRGLELVTMLADQWGTRPAGRGKAIWCSVPLRGADL